MSVEQVGTLIVGGGQAGIAMSEHLTRMGISHLAVEKDRIAESWRTGRWDSLVANGPAWHDRFPGMMFSDLEPDSFAPKDRVVRYFEDYARQIAAPIRCGVAVTGLHRRASGSGFRAETSQGPIEADNVVVATGPFQRPTIPAICPQDTGILQLHSNAYRNPVQLPDGAVLVVGAGSSGVQIADELLSAGRRVYLSVGRHSRPPRRYRGQDFCWWLGALGKWDAQAAEAGSQHVTIAVSGAHGGRTVDLREFAARGMTLLGQAQSCRDGVMTFAPDLAANVALGDADMLSMLGEADAYTAREGLDLPQDPAAWLVGPDPACVTNPVLELDLAGARVASIIWATGYALDFDWIKLGAFDERGHPVHRSGISAVPGLYFLGLPWLSRRASSFIWGVWTDAGTLAQHVAARRNGNGLRPARADT